MKIRITLVLILGIMALVISMPTFAVDNGWAALGCTSRAHCCATCVPHNDCDRWCPVGESGNGFLNEPLPPGVLQVVTHFATPIRIYAREEGLDCYYVGQGQSHSAGLLPTFASLAAQYPPGTPSVVLEENFNPAVGQPVYVTYLPTEQRIQFRTAYASGKPYVFRIDAGNQVEYLDW